MRRTSKLLFSLGDGDGPLNRQLYRRMRGLILDGSWPVGTRLPSSRVLAAELGVSRNTAMHALDLLMADGWVESRPGSALYVSLAAPPPVARVSEASARPPPRRPLPFEIGRQTAEFFPVDHWNRLQRGLIDEAGPELLYGTDGPGLPRLCRAIAAYLGESRALAVEPDQVVVVPSTQAAIDLVTRTVGQPGDRVWVEDPGYQIAHGVFEVNGLIPVRLPVDADGLSVADGTASAPDARIAYATPTCQFPLGVTMSGARRRALLDWATAGERWVIEDDWDWHARFDGQHGPPPLRASPGGDRVIYVQSFSRTMFPGLRIAFLVAPPALLPRLSALYELIDGRPNVMVQAILARFLEDGLYAAHLRVTRAAYAERRAALAAALVDLPVGYRVRSDRAGLHLIVATPPGTEDVALATAIRSRGLQVLATGELARTAQYERGLILGFAAFTPDKLVTVGKVLTDAIRSITDRPNSG